MRRIITESFQDIETYLLSQELMDKLTEELPGWSNGDYSSDEITDKVVEILTDEFPDDSGFVSERVIVLKVKGEDVEVVTADHYAIRYNGSYYDYSAVLLNDSFSGLINRESTPVVQNVITNDLQINDKVSTVKGYAMLAYK